MSDAREVWRDLDWMPDSEKQALAVSERSNIAAALVGVFDSQVTGGKRYDLATAGRRLAHATYFASHGTDEESALARGLRMQPGQGRNAGADLQILAASPAAACA